MNKIAIAIITITRNLIFDFKLFKIAYKTLSLKVSNDNLEIKEILQMKKQEKNN